ncbi:uncharacterized protein TNCV_3119971 [Trichonephila clavipes]|uniref:Transposase n=1 Tax=Trichonephila clavipes TaxID=2585209 RepID=A0A8X6WA77_TRICX|nr:uncharacterized protein TNCV_3119971 [Trichonephila clavipes]
MSSRHHIDDFMRGRIIGKIEEGRKITDVAREFDIAHSVASRPWKSFKTTGMCSRRHGGGRVRNTTPAEDIYRPISKKEQAHHSSAGGKSVSCCLRKEDLPKNCCQTQVAGRNYPPTNKNTLIRALTEEWDKLPQQLLDNVVQNSSFSLSLNLLSSSESKLEQDRSPPSDSCSKNTHKKLATISGLRPFLRAIVSGCLLCTSCQVIYSQFGLTIHQNDHQARRRFVEWAQNEIAVVLDFHKRILFSDEAHFWLNGYVNKQNCRIWSEANPQVHVETPLHPEKLTVCCALWAGGIIGPYFFKNDEGHNVTVNGDRYRAMITNFFIPELNNHDVQELWFQQDGATCHTARATIDLLKDMFGDRLISRFGPVNWPPRSWDLTPLDYFLWGYVKSLVYADKPQTLDHLKDNIRRVIADIRPQMLEKVIENGTSRLDYIRASCGSPMPEIIFKM